MGFIPRNLQITLVDGSYACYQIAVIAIMQIVIIEGISVQFQGILYFLIPIRITGICCITCSRRAVDILCRGSIGNSVLVNRQDVITDINQVISCIINDIRSIISLGIIGIFGVIGNNFLAFNYPTTRQRQFNLSLSVFQIDVLRIILAICNAIITGLDNIHIINNILRCIIIAVCCFIMSIGNGCRKAGQSLPCRCLNVDAGLILQISCGL